MKPTAATVPEPSAAGVSVPGVTVSPERRSDAATGCG
jgi:hypothetical protein